MYKEVMFSLFFLPQLCAQNYDDSICSLVEKTLKKQPVGMVIGVLESGKTSFYGFGTTKLSNNIIPDENTLFEIGSITKLFTAHLVQIILKKKDLKEDTFISEIDINWLPAITFEQLMTHTSGLPRLPSNLNSQNYLNPYDGYGQNELKQFFKDYHIEKGKIDKYNYSNLGFGLLGFILEKITKKPFNQLIQEIICNPLGLENTAIVLSREQEKKLTGAYCTFNPEIYLNESNSFFKKIYLVLKDYFFPIVQFYEVEHWNLDILTGCGGLKSTAYDLLEYAKYYIQNKKDMNCAAWITYCNKKELNGDEIIYWHNGATFGSRSFIGFNEVTKKAVVILSNTFSYSNQIDKLGLDLLAN